MRPRRHPALPPERWPEADRLAWEDAHRQLDFLAEPGRASAWRSASERSARGAYGRWLLWLSAQGVDLQAEAPAIRFSQDRLRAYMEYLHEGRSPVTAASYLGILCMVVVAVFPDRDWNWLRAVQRRLRHRARPVRDKQARIVPAGQLLQLGLDLIERAGAVLDRSGMPGMQLQQLAAAARDHRDGLIIALLASRPLRVRNLLGIEIGRQLRQNQGRATLHFDTAETKGNQSLDVTWPQILLPPLERYLAEVRPLLVAASAPGNVGHLPRPPSVRLWVGQGGSPLTPGGLQKALARHTGPRFGHPVNAHLFRACAASTLANAAPEAARHAAALLGHRGMRTTERSYIAPDSRIALGRHHDLIRSMRKRVRRRRSAEAAT